MIARNIPDDVARHLAEGLADTVIQCWPEATDADVGAIGAAFVERLALRSKDSGFVMFRVACTLKDFIRTGQDMADRSHSDTRRPTTPAPEPVGAG
jgi:hypothetical protein